MPPNHIIIIGAGPAGLTAAHQLARAGIRTTVFEASDHVGGMACSIQLWGQTVDLGPHRFFSFDRQVNALWLELAGNDYRILNRLTRIYYRERFFNYPLNARNALSNIGLGNALWCVASYLGSRFSAGAKPLDTFEDWVVRHFGRRLYEIFFKPYSEKLWGIPGSELDSDFAAQRIKKFSLGQAVLAALNLGKKKHKTLVEQFAYPTGGTGMIYERMAGLIRLNGGVIRLCQPIAGVMREANRITGVRLPDGTEVAADHVISTMPLTLLVKSLGDLPDQVADSADALRFRNTILVYLKVDSSQLFSDQWLYIHSPELRCGRITNFRNWAPELHGAETSSILALEFWCNDEDEMWKDSDAVLAALATDELAKTGLQEQASILASKVVRIPRCYPVYQAGYKAHLARIVTHLKQFEGITPIGRYGAFKYNNQDHSIHMGMLAAQNLVSGTQHDLWASNTDYDSYQESAEVPATGLDVLKSFKPAEAPPL